MTKECIAFLIAVSCCTVCSGQNPVQTCKKIHEIEIALTTKRNLSRTPAEFNGMWINEKAADDVLDIRQDKILWRTPGHNDTTLISDIKAWADSYTDNVPSDTALHIFVKRNAADVFLYVEKTGGRLLVRVSAVALVATGAISKDRAAPGILTTNTTTYWYKKAVAGVR